MTTTAVLAFPVDEKFKIEYDGSNRKHPDKVNKIKI